MAQLLWRLGLVESCSCTSSWKLIRIPPLCCPHIHTIITITINTITIYIIMLQLETQDTCKSIILLTVPSSQHNTMLFFAPTFSNSKFHKTWSFGQRPDHNVLFFRSVCEITMPPPYDWSDVRGLEDRGGALWLLHNDQQSHRIIVIIGLVFSWKDSDTDLDVNKMKPEFTSSQLWRETRPRWSWSSPRSPTGSSKYFHIYSVIETIIT